MEIQPAVDRPTVRAHKRQFAWQILLPMILVLLVGLVAGGFVIANSVSGQGSIRPWADVSLIWLIAPVLFFALAFLAILVAIIYGMVKLLQVTPHYTGKAQGFFDLVSATTRKLADRVAQPVVWVRQAGAVLKSIFRL